MQEPLLTFGTSTSLVHHAPEFPTLLDWHCNSIEIAARDQRPHLLVLVLLGEMFRSQLNLLWNLLRALDVRCQMLSFVGVPIQFRELGRSGSLDGMK